MAHDRCAAVRRFGRTGCGECQVLTRAAVHEEVPQRASACHRHADEPPGPAGAFQVAVLLYESFCDHIARDRCPGAGCTHPGRAAGRTAEAKFTIGIQGASRQSQTACYDQFSTRSAEGDAATGVIDLQVRQTAAAAGDRLCSTAAHDQPAGARDRARHG